MMRREITEPFPRPTAAVAAPSSIRINPGIGRAGLLGMLLVLLLGARAGLAETSDSLDLAMALGSVPPPAAIAFSVGGVAGVAGVGGVGGTDTDRRERADGLDAAADEQLVIAVAAEVDDALPTAEEPSRVLPEELFFMSSLGARSWRPLTTDEALAVAVSHGTNPDLKPRNPFRKRSSDLFKTNFRQVKIGRAEMLMRLRLRAKASKAISVEVRF
jgi:hypothetical protein